MRKSKQASSTQMLASLALAGILGLSTLSTTAYGVALDLKTGDTLNVATSTVDESKSYDSILFNGGTLNFGSTNDKQGTVSSGGSVVLNGGTITVDGSGTKVSGALVMKPENNRIPVVVEGTNNKFIDNTDPNIAPPVHSVNAATTMTINNISINIGAPKYDPATGPSQAEISKSYEGYRLDLKSAGNMEIKGGDFRVANIAFPIKKQDKAALRFESEGTLTVSGGKFVAQGQPVGNPARNNYDSPSLYSLQGKQNLVITDGQFDIESTRFHLGSKEGKVLISGGTFNINSNSPYPGWKTFDTDLTTGKVTERPQDKNTQERYKRFGSLDVSGSLLEVTGGTFNIGDANDKTPNYINLADKLAVIKGGTFNIYTGSSLSNNKANMRLEGGTYNLINGGYMGGRNTDGASVEITGGDYLANASTRISVSTEADYLDKAGYNKTGVDIAGGKFIIDGGQSAKQETFAIAAPYAVNISGGEFIRTRDGAVSDAFTFSASGQKGVNSETAGDLNISGGVYKTKNPILSFTEDPKVDTNRKTAIKLSDGSGKFNETLASGTQAEKDALAAGKASDAAQKVTGMEFTAAKNLNISGGTFELAGANLKKFHGDKLNITGGTFNMSEAYTEMGGTKGIDIKGGTFTLNGTKEYAQYDLGRDRWVLGSRLTFVTDGPLSFGEVGTAGPVFNIKDSLVMALPVTSGGKVGDFTFNSGKYNLDGTFRSTLWQAGGKMIINGGDFRVTSSDDLYAKSLTGEEAKSMITMSAVDMKAGSMYLYNADLNGLNAINVSGGKFTIGGVSKINSNGTYDPKPNVAGTGVINISGGEFIREKDGINSAQVTFNSSTDINISGGTFKTANPVNFVRDNNIVITRDDNVRLYNAEDFIIDPKTGDKLYQLHTETTVKAIFATGDQAKIKAAFAPKNDMNYLPTEKEVLTSLKAVMDYKTALTQKAWTFEAGRDMNITGGNFDLSTPLASSFTAKGTLNVSDATIISKSGGGTITFTGKEGINIKSGTIASYGGDENGAFALQYDYRNRLDRDRWTLGKYVSFVTDGDITLGTKGSNVGPTVYYQDGMLGMRAKNLYLYSGSLTLNGMYRSTLQSGAPGAMLIDGGTFNVLTSDAINRNKIDSSSMWNVPLTMKSGAVNLYNAQLGGSHFTMEGGVATALGDSALNATSAGYVDLKAGLVNLGERAYIGAIKGDSTELSPYVTGTKEVKLGKDLAVNLTLTKPASGDKLVVGQNIGGIYTSANNKGKPTGDATSITIADSSIFRIDNPFTLDAGKYTAEGFVEAQNGTVTMTPDKYLHDYRFYAYEVSKVAADKANMVVTIKDTSNVISGALGVNSNVRDNAQGFSELLRNAQGNWLGVRDVVANGSVADASELLRQVGGENTTAAAQNMVGSVGEFRSRMHSQGKSNISGLNSGDSMSSNGYRGWISAMGNWASQGTKDGVQGFDSGSGGMALGFDTTFNDRYTLGLGLGYANSYANSKDGKSTSKGDTFFASLYGSLDFNPVVIDADVTYANTKNKINTTINAGGVFGENEGEYGVDSWSAGLKASYIFAFNNNATKLAPYVGIEFLSINQHGYSESGPLARDFGSDFSTLWTLPVGIKLSHQFKGEQWSFTPEVGVGYARDLNEFKPASHITVPGVTATEITAYGSRMSPDSFRANAGFSLKYKDNLEFFGMYKLDARDQYTGHGVNVGFSYSF